MHEPASCYEAILPVRSSNQPPSVLKVDFITVGSYYKTLKGSCVRDIFSYTFYSLYLLIYPVRMNISQMTLQGGSSEFLTININ